MPSAKHPPSLVGADDFGLKSPFSAVLGRNWSISGLCPKIDNSELDRLCYPKFSPRRGLDFGCQTIPGSCRPDGPRKSTLGSAPPPEARRGCRPIFGSRCPKIDNFSPKGRNYQFLDTGPENRPKIGRCPAQNRSAAYPRRRVGCRPGVDFRVQARPVGWFPVSKI